MMFSVRVPVLSVKRYSIWPRSSLMAVLMKKLVKERGKRRGEEEREGGKLLVNSGGRVSWSIVHLHVPFDDD